jgi:hypothetical protein
MRPCFTTGTPFTITKRRPSVGGDVETVPVAVTAERSHLRGIEARQYSQCAHGLSYMPQIRPSSLSRLVPGARDRTTSFRERTVSRCECPPASPDPLDSCESKPSADGMPLAISRIEPGGGASQLVRGTCHT